MSSVTEHTVCCSPACQILLLLVGFGLGPHCRHWPVIGFHLLMSSGTTPSPVAGVMSSLHAQLPLVLHAVQGMPLKPLCIELHKKGSRARNHPSFEMKPPYSIQKVHAYLEAMVDALEYEDINLTRLGGHRLLDAASFDNLAQEHAAQGTPVMVEVKYCFHQCDDCSLRHKACSMHNVCWLRCIAAASARMRALLWHAIVTGFGVQRLYDR